MRVEEFTIEGRNAVLEALRSGRPIDRLYIQDGCKDGPVQTAMRAGQIGGTQDCPQVVRILDPVEKKQKRILLVIGG